MPNIITNCPKCRAKVEVPPGKAGRWALCKCGNLFKIGAPSGVSVKTPVSKKRGYHVTVRGDTYGPYAADRMREMIRAGRIGPGSLVWGKTLKEWTPLERVAEFSEDLRAAAAEPAADAGHEDVEEMWHFQHGDVRRGPMSLDEIVAACREGQVRADDRVWSNRMNGWRDAAETPELAEALAAGVAVDQGELWYFRTSEGVEGPVSFEDLRAFVEEKLVRPGDGVYGKSLVKWQDIRDVPQLHEAIAAAERGLGAADRSAQQWYFRSGGRERGPVTERFMAERVTGRSLKAHDYVYGPGSPEWRRVRDVPELARYCDPRDLADAPAEEITSRSAHRGSAIRVRSKTTVIVIAACVVGLAVAVALIALLHGEADSPDPDGFAVPTEPVALAGVWVDLFLTDAQALPSAERRKIEARLKRLTADGGLDVYSADVREALRAFVRVRGRTRLQVERAPCAIGRAEDGDTFCYHASPIESASITVPVGPQRTEKTFYAKDFEELRCVRLRAGKLVTGVLLSPDGDGWKVTGFGRVAFVGAGAGPMQFRYVTGVRSADPSEASVMLRGGVARSTPSGDQWGPYGDLMGMDVTLVPTSVQEARRDDPGRGPVLVRADTGMSFDEVVRRYGPPQLTAEVDLSAADLRVLETAGGAAYYTRLKAHYYGAFGIAVDKASGRVIGFLFEPPSP